MADDSVGEGAAQLVLGGAVGFALYLLVTSLGLGRRGEGTGASGRGAGTAPTLPAAPPVPARSRDVQRLTFVLQEPTISGRPMIFRLRDDDPSTRTYTLADVIARVTAGGRSDVNLAIRGDVLQGAADAARQLLSGAGLAVSTDGSARVSGNARGAYGRTAWERRR